MVDVKTFVENVQKIASERPTYRLGGDGSDGTCDCIGLVIGAIERAGGDWNGTHGSNFAARYRMAAMHKQLEAADLELGWAVYKAKAPGEAGYSLPSKYDDHPDRMDYYHVGVVTGIEPLEITHCTQSGSVDGIKKDNKQGQWLYAGPLSLVDYGGEAVSMATATVRASSGSTVKMRAKASTQTGLYWEVPVGASVALLAQSGEWSQIYYNGRTGYMQSRFLDTGEKEVSENEKGLVITLSRSAANELMAALKAAGIQ